MMFMEINTASETSPFCLMQTLYMDIYELTIHIMRVWAPDSIYTCSFFCINCPRTSTKWQIVLLNHKKLFNICVLLSKEWPTNPKKFPFARIQSFWALQNHNRAPKPSQTPSIQSQTAPASKLSPFRLNNFLPSLLHPESPMIGKWSMVLPVFLLLPRRQFP